MQIILDDELKLITDHARINEIQRAVNFLIAEGLQTCLYTSKTGMKIAVNKIGGNIKVIKVG